MSSTGTEDAPISVSPTGAPLYKVAPVTKIRVEPSKALKSPFLVKRQSLRRPDTKILECLYRDITTNPSATIWQERFNDLPELVKIEEVMNDEQKKKKEETMSNWLNFVVSNMAREDARDFWNTKCLGWRHYVHPKWAETSMSGNLDPKGLKKLFYGGSVLYNASQSHMVFIPVFHDHQWTLYAFNMCDQKLSILDSRPDTTKGVDPTERHQETRCNICDALTVTMNYAIDFRSWEYQFPKVPRQPDSYSLDSGFFVFNFMRLWDGHQLVRWFPIESTELRKDFLAYIILCKEHLPDNNEHLPGNNEHLPGNSEHLPGNSEHLPDNSEHLPDNSEHLPVKVLINKLPGEMMDCTMQKVAREGGRHCTENQGDHGGVGSSNNAASAPVENGPDVEAPAMLSAPDPASASSDFLGKCHRVTSDGDGVFHIAARFCNVKIVSEIYMRDRELAKVLLSAVNDRGDTTLHCAAAGGSEEMVDLLTENMIRDNMDGIAMFLRAKNLKGETCLHEAVRHGHLEIVETLIWKDSINPDLRMPMLVQIVDNEGISPLYLATTLRKIKIVEALKLYAATSAAGPAGKTALHAAVVLLDKGLVKTLLEWNAGLTSQVDESGSTPLHFLASLSLERREPNSIVQFVYNFLHFFNCLKICLCCKLDKDLGIVELIMEKNQDLALHADFTGSVPIHIAAAHGRLDIVKKLLKKCPYCESSRNASGQTFLHVAVEKEKVDIVEYVCGEEEFNGILNAVDHDGNTALHLAVIKASENAVNTANEKIFCTLMSARYICLSFANKKGHTPLDLAFLNLHPEVISMKGPREWIYFDLLHGGADFGVGGWDRLAGNLVEPDWEKESERVGKTASMLALSVLILNASFLVPFSLLNRMDKWNVDLDRLQGGLAFLFQIFVIFDSIAFSCSVMATYFCASAGFAMLDGRTRLKNLMSGTFYVIMAAPALIIAVALALYLVLPSMTFALPIIFAGFGILLSFIFGFFESKITSIVAHLSAVRARVGFPKLARILLFQRSAIKPLWVVPSASTRLFWVAAAVFFVYFIPTSVVQVFQQNISV